MRILFSSFCMLLFFVSCKKEMIAGEISTDKTGQMTALASNVTATKAEHFDSLFTRYDAGQWTGGDVAYSTLLPDGRSFWLWGDSFVDTVYPDRHRPFDGFIHNSIVLTDANANFITTLYGGTEKRPVAFFNAPAPKEYWPNSAFTSKDKSKLYVMMSIIEVGGSGIFGFTLKGNAVGILSLPDCKLLQIVDISKNPTVDWSSCTLEEDGYVYLYGAESTQYNKFMHVARTPLAKPFSKMEYYDGVNWTTNPNQSVRVQGGVSEAYSVFKYGSNYYLLTQGNLLSADIYLFNAASPVGPFTNKRKVYTTPQAGGNIITYNATAHTEFIQNGQLLVGYCTNSLNSGDIYRNADNYRPYFIWLSNWQ